MTRPLMVAANPTVLVQWLRAVLMCALLGGTMALTGCASTAQNPADPFEGFNRGVYKFNDTVDRAVIKPVAQGYKAVVPEPARDCVGNIFGNIGDVFTAVNNLLQGKPVEALGDVCRVAINTTIGILGCFDVASKAGLDKHKEDFGQTFGRWGVGSGPYLVLPFFGPSTVRDTFGLILDSKTDPVGNLDDIATRNWLLALRVVDTRASLLDAGSLMQDISLDPYVFLRDAYLQRRRSLIHDGNPPDSGEDVYEDPESGDPQSNLELDPSRRDVSGKQVEYAEPSLYLGKPWFDEPNQRVWHSSVDQVAPQARSSGQDTNLHALLIP